MKKSILLIIILVNAYNAYSQSDFCNNYSKWDDSYLNMGVATMGIVMGNYSFIDNTPLSFDGNFSRSEKYLFTGASLVALAVLNDQLHLVEMHPTKEKALRFGLFASSIVFDAISDSRRDKGLVSNSKFYETLSLTSLVSSSALSLKEGEKWKIFVSYALVRHATFSYIYNRDRELPLDYNGTTSKYDVAVDKSGDWLHVSRAVGLIGGIVLSF